MPAYNSSNTICASIKCVLEQTYSFWELIVINDGSSDDTLDKINRYDDPRIRVITQDNQGVSVARNIGLKLACGEYIAFLDSDDLWLVDKLEKQISFFEKSCSSLGLIYTKCRGFINDSNISFSMDVDASIGYADPYHRLLIMDYIPTLTVMMRASIINDIGYFSENLRGTEDWDYWLRIAEKFKLQQLDLELALYRINSNSLSGNKDRHALEELKVLDKHLDANLVIPKEVSHMARSFWYFKKIKYQLQAGRFIDAVTSLLNLMLIRPAFFKNYLNLIMWSFSYVCQRAAALYTRK